MNNKIIVILGPTSSGKSDIAIKLAKKFSGEIISADSRQIYRGLNIGTGKVEAGQLAEIPQEFTNSKFYEGPRLKKPFISHGIVHYAIDIISPKTEYNAAKFKKYANKIILNILKQGKLPIICGGTGFWIKSIVDNVIYPEVKPDWMLRSMLGNKTKEELFSMLRKLDPERAKTIDKNNPVRLIRAIEICKTLGKVPIIKENKKYDFLQIGINLSKEKLHANIKKRLAKRFEAGIIEEVKNLHKIDKLSWKKIESFGLGYKLIPEYLRKEVYPVKSGKAGARLFNKELFEHIYQAEKNYAKRQMTWFKKDKRILWLEDYRNIKNEVSNFILR